MIHLIIDAIGGFGLLCLGIYVGSENSVTVSKAITTIETAEASAQATLTKIFIHKNTPSTAVPVTTTTTVV